MQPTQPASTSPISGSLATALVRVAREHRVLVSRGLADLGLHPGQELMLAELWNQDGLSQSELATRLGVELPTVVKTVQRLEATGLITRAKDPHDRRVTRVTLTDRGQGLRAAVEAVWTRAEEAMVRGISTRDAEQMSKVLEQFHRNLSTTRHTRDENMG
ncbi:MarR family winged helix-turn-helix transcriptional regulator [Streptomyces marincola]|uniref:MarR family winged helix-turn-helix transcriptional regulator n=1 Tax=Streptomyces marincola TaxID=2878388 RepID=UPI001CF22F1E|nr:MarR family transcriptional regulator [Streptomyces marincola]UCM89260.1 MarR family transcriptional regulator [Streptomyces marincola]